MKKVSTLLPPRRCYSPFRRRRAASRRYSPLRTAALQFIFAARLPFLICILLQIYVDILTQFTLK